MHWVFVIVCSIISILLLYGMIMNGLSIFGIIALGINLSAVILNWNNIKDIKKFKEKRNYYNEIQM